jgi:hypothetical protein
MPPKPFQRSYRYTRDKLVFGYYWARIQSPTSPYHIALRPKPYQILLLLSHMRSGSSLLTHLLADNPEIIGYGETHLRYAQEPDFKTLIEKVYWTVRGFNMGHTYVLDKILHDQKLEPQLLQAPPIRGIFLVRQPQATLASLCKLKAHWSEEKAVDYYCDRLTSLAHYSQIIDNPDRAYFLTYQTLLNHTKPTFQGLQQFLQVQAPFGETYQVMPLTGFKGVGDSSVNIKAGKILRDRPQTDITLSAPALARAQTAFHQCCATLSQTCTTLYPDKSPSV